MAKRKKKKAAPKKTDSEFIIQLYGVVLIIMAILGIGKYGPVGRLIASFGLFLVGSIYMLFLLTFFIVGAYLLVKRAWPNFFSTKLLGIYIFLIGFLVIMHREFVIQNNSNATLIFKETIDQLLIGFNSIMHTGSLEDWFAVGGGLIGGVFAIIFVKLFSYMGMQLISCVLIIGGISMFTGFSIIDFIKDKYEESKAKRQELSEEDDAEKVEDTDNDNQELKPVIISDGNEEEEDNKHVKISSIEELTKVPVKDKENPSPEETKPSQPANKDYQLPPITILTPPKKKNKGTDNSAIEKNIESLEKVLRDFKINGKVVEVHIGPTVAQYELEIASGTRVSKIISLNREIALALSKKDVRIEAPIPGKSTVGIEFANDSPTPVSFYEIMNSNVMQKAQEKILMVPLGKSIMGDIGVCEINKMPHLLIAGTTGSGKSVCVNGIICSILMRAKPTEVKLVMVDPKVVELSVYNGIPHLLCPVVTDPKKASIALAKMVAEMEKRYQIFSETKTKNIESYNEYIEKCNKENNSEYEQEKMPYIVVIIDELADLMMVAAKEVEDSILRITQKARAAGIHLIVATQRPSTEVITGLIKANIPSRISFAVGSGIDSRTVLDQIGAEKLLGKGDMLFLPIGVNSPIRIQGSFITDDEIKKLIDFTVAQQQAQYDDSLMNLEAPESSSTSSSDATGTDDASDVDDPLYKEIVQFVVSTQKASASLIQRKFKLGYNRAARIIDLLEERGIIGPVNGSKPREVLVQLDASSPSEESIEEG